jgi:CO/xanthine dehydrogenase FAD-binding subunit
VAHALPAADGTIALLAFDAQAEIASQAGLRRAPLLELFRGPGKSALDAPREILVGFYLPLSGPGQASAFKRVMRPQGVALPILNMACWLARQGEQVTAARLSIGPAGPTPRRLFGVEALLAGRPLDAAALESARQAVGGEVSFRTSPHRATAAYRQHLVGSLMEDVLRLAWERAARA